MKTPNFSKAEILNAFEYRHACKEFDPTRKLSEEDVNFILKLANLSPSSFGFEPWHFIVVQDKELREALKPIAWGAPAKLDTSSHFILGLTMKAPMTKWGSDHTLRVMKEMRKMPEEMMAAYSKFHKEFIENDFNLDTDRKLFDWASKQCYIALANMMTGAAMIGIDSCPIEGFHQQKVELLLKEKFDVDTTLYGLSYMVAFGYRKNDVTPKSRRDLTEIVTWK